MQTKGFSGSPWVLPKGLESSNVKNNLLFASIDGKVVIPHILIHSLKSSSLGFFKKFPASN